MFEATGPGSTAFTVTPRPSSRRASSSVKYVIASLERRVGAHEGVAALELEIVEVERCHAVGIGRDVHDARGRALEQARQQPQGELEHRQVVDREGELDSLGVALPRLADEARVVDEHVQRPAAGQVLRGGAVDRLARGEIADAGSRGSCRRSRRQSRPARGGISPGCGRAAPRRRPASRARGRRRGRGRRWRRSPGRRGPACRSRAPPHSPATPKRWR